MVPNIYPLQFHRFLGAPAGFLDGTGLELADADFEGVETTYYWTSTPLAADPTYVWCVDLFEGVVFYAYEVNYYYVWPVRSGL